LPGRGNKRYIQGRNAEYLVKKELERLGYFVQRSAGSKSVDLLAILTQKTRQEEIPIIRAVMVSTSHSPEKIKTDSKKLLKIKFPAIVAMEIWIKEKRKTQFKQIKVEVGQ